MNILAELKKIGGNNTEFTETMIPSKYKSLGLTMPKLREFAKKLVKENKTLEVLNNFNFKYMDDLILYGLILNYAKLDYDTKIKYLTKYIDYMENWAVVDVTISKNLFNENEYAKFWEYIQRFIKSKKEFEVRVVAVSILQYFINDKYIKQALKILDSLDDSTFYAMMGIAWAISFICIKYPHLTKQFLKTSKLSNKTINKAIQKSRESFRVSQKDKDDLLKLKRK